ncbi:MFS family permease [Bradyrhizobium sp. USDA 4369]
MSAPATPQETPGLAIWLGFILMCVGMFMAILDIQVVATSLPTIQEALGITPDAMSWVQTAYLIAEIIAIPLTGLLTSASSACAGCSSAPSASSRRPRSAAR